MRTIHVGLPDTVAARMMGHSVTIHTCTYHHWITRRDQQQAVDAVLARNRPNNTLLLVFTNDDLISEAAGLPLPLDLRHGHGGVVAECWRGGAPSGPRARGGAAHLKPGAAVLDLCCGSGEAAAPWLAAGYAVTGLMSPPAP